MALEDADGPTSPRLSIRTEIDGRGPPLDIILQIVYKSNQETEERQITLKNSTFPLMRDLYDAIWQVYPQFDPGKTCIYWRYNLERFMPIYDYLSLRSAIILMADVRFYVIHMEDCVDGVVYTRIPKFNFQAKKSDQYILRRAIQYMSKQFSGYTVDTDLNFKHLNHTIKGGETKNSEKDKPKERAKSTKK